MTQTLEKTIQQKSNSAGSRLIQPKNPFALYRMRDAITRMLPPVIGFDIETTAKEPWDGDVRLLQISVDNDVYVIDYRDFLFTYFDDFHIVMKSILESRAIVKVSHNGKFEAKWMLYHFQIEIQMMFDTMVGSQLLAAGLEFDEFNNRIGHGLDDNVMRYLGREMDKTEQLSNWNAPVLTQSQIVYAAKDALVMVPLYRKQLTALIRDGLLRVAMIEFDCIVPIAQLEINGFHLDVDMWKALLDKKTVERDRVQADLMALLQSGVDWMSPNPEKRGKRPVKPKKPVNPKKSKALRGTEITDEMMQQFDSEMRQWQIETLENGYKIEDWKALPDEVPATLNLNSWQQLLVVFKNLYNLNLTATNDEVLTPYGEMTVTDRKTGEKSSKYPAIEKLLEYRKWEKSITAYGQNVIDKCDANNRVHADFKQNGAGTGRMSCGGGVNLQNIPNDSEHRYCWTAPKGKKLVIADYSQIELRILADFSGDQNFINAFCSGQDFHTITAAQTFNCSVEEVTSAQRSFAKRLNFGVVYGVGSAKFAMQAGITEAEADGIMSRYFETYRGNDVWLREAANQARNQGFTRTASGRLMRFNIRGATKRQLSGIGRNGRNSPIQGTGADMLKRALYLTHVSLKGTSGKLVNVVHDEVIIECDAAEADLICTKLETAMESSGREFVKRVPIKVDAKPADKWEK